MSKPLTLTFALVLAVLSPRAWTDDTLAVPLIGQEQSQWCWDAAALMVLEFYGHAGPTQEVIAAYAVGGNNLPNSLDANGVVQNVPGVGVVVFQGCKQVLRQFGPVQSSYLGRALTLDEVETEMDDQRPAILGISWSKKVGAKIKLVGGHANVLSAKSGNLITLNDPWPANNAPAMGNPGVKYIVDYTALFNTPDQGTYSGSANLGNTWNQTLKTGRPLDICFLIDSTASMSDDIDEVKAIASDLVDQLAVDFKDLRVAVVDYRDEPVSPWGSPGDYITNVRLGFAGYTDPADAVGAIEGIAVAGGADWPEAVYTAVLRTLSGSEIGDWREEAERYVILMGDAPGHNPEPWPGGSSYADVLSFAGSLEDPVSVYSLAIGGDPAALADFGALSGATGGGLYEVEGAGGVVGAIEQIVGDFTTQPRSPSGGVAAFTPLFTFVPPTETMLAPPHKAILVVERFNEKKGKWTKSMKAVLPTPDATSYRPKKDLPIQSYRWHIEYVRKPGIFTLPSGEAQKVKGGKFAEEGWTEFDREEVVPQAPLLLSPTSFFVAVDKKTEFQVGTAVNADKYVVEVFRAGELKAFKTFTLKPSKKDPDATVLAKTVGGFKLGNFYTWRAQGLNRDRKKPVEDGWSTLSPQVLLQSPDGTRSNLPDLVDLPLPPTDR